MFTRTLRNTVEFHKDAFEDDFEPDVKTKVTFLYEGEEYIPIMETKPGAWGKVLLQWVVPEHLRDKGFAVKVEGKGIVTDILHPFNVTSVEIVCRIPGPQGKYLLLKPKVNAKGPVYQEVEMDGKMKKCYLYDAPYAQLDPHKEREMDVIKEILRGCDISRDDICKTSVIMYQKRRNASGYNARYIIDSPVGKCDDKYVQVPVEEIEDLEPDNDAIPDGKGGLLIIDTWIADKFRKV